jgi:hypothetical protein
MTLHEVFYQDISIGSIRSYLSSIPYVSEDRTTWAYLQSLSAANAMRYLSQIQTT